MVTIMRWGENPEIRVIAKSEFPSETGGWYFYLDGTRGAESFADDIWIEDSFGGEYRLKPDGVSTWNSGQYAVRSRNVIIHGGAGNTVFSSFHIKTKSGAREASGGISVYADPPRVSEWADRNPFIFSDGWLTVELDNSAVSENCRIEEWMTNYSRVHASIDTSKISVRSSVSGYDPNKLECSVTYKSVVSGWHNYPIEGEIIGANKEVYSDPIIDDLCWVTIKAVHGSKKNDYGGTYAVYDYIIRAYPYAPPTMELVSVYRSDSMKQPYDDGRYITAKARTNFAPVNGHNSLTFTAEYKEADAASYGTPYTMQSDVPALINGLEISPAKSYRVRLTARDRGGRQVVYEQVIPTRAVCFNLKDGGNGAAFGKFAEADNQLQIPEDWLFRIGSTTLSEEQLRGLINLLQ